MRGGIRIFDGVGVDGGHLAVSVAILIANIQELGLKGLIIDVFYNHYHFYNKLVIYKST